MFLGDHKLFHNDLEVGQIVIKEDLREEIRPCRGRTLFHALRLSLFHPFRMILVIAVSW